MGTPKGSIPWNAGTSKGWTDKRGYRWLYVIENGRRRARREHRVIVERHIGRRMEPWEVVHHKDGNTSNHSIENLVVTEFGTHTAEHHAGTRRSADAKRSMEAFALMREELKAERSINEALLEALKRFVEYESAMDNRDDVSGMLIYADFSRMAREAIAKATGGAQ